MLSGENVGRRGLCNPPEPRMNCLVVSPILTPETSTCVGMAQMQITLRPPTSVSEKEKLKCSSVLSDNLMEVA